MKLVTWNINGIRAAVRKGLVPKLQALDADIIAFQEIKCQDEVMQELFVSPQQSEDLFGLSTPHKKPSKLISPEDKAYLSHYVCYWHTSKARKGYSGTALLVKKNLHGLIHDTMFEVGVDHLDTEGRLTGIKLEMNNQKYLILCGYYPQGGREGRVRFKIEFYAALTKQLQKLRDQGYTLLLCGDLNTTISDIDLARPKENRKTTGCLPQERVALNWLIADTYFDSTQLVIQDTNYLDVVGMISKGLGLHDAFRFKYPDMVDAYSYWDQITRARERNVGWRIDYWLVDKAVEEKIIDCIIRDDIMGSDHCPVVLELDVG